MAAQTTIDRFALREYLRAREEPDLFLGGMEGSRYPNANASPGSVILSLKTFSARFPLAGYATLRSFACGIRYRLLRTVRIASGLYGDLDQRNYRANEPQSSLGKTDCSILFPVRVRCLNAIDEIAPSLYSWTYAESNGVRKSFINTVYVCVLFTIG